MIERAFEPFFTTKPKGEGSGLGLATVYGVVAQMGGFTQLYSEPGLGTTISLLFPVSRDALTSAAITNHDRVRGRETILVAEDEEAIREVTRRVLQRNGYTVVTVPTGTQAIDALDRLPEVDLLLTDVVMPQMSGKELAERITTLRPGVRGALHVGLRPGSARFPGPSRRRRRPGGEALHRTDVAGPGARRARRRHLTPGPSPDRLNR